MNKSMLEAVPYVRELALLNDDIILEELGLTTRKSGDLQCKCPIHNGDNRTAFSYDGTRKMWKCWTHHCHEKYGCDLIGLVMGVNQCTFKEALEFILAVSKNTEVYGSPEIRQFIRLHEPKKNIEFNADFLKDKDKDTPYFLSRGYQQDLLNQFDAFRYKNREYLPVVTDDSKILGFVGRTTVPDEGQPKWKLYPDEMNKNDTLFGINIAKTHLRNLGEAVIVEGPLDVMRLHQYGIKTAVGTMGTSISQEQIKMLLKYNVKQVIIAYDPDDAGIKAAAKLAKKLDLYFRVVDKTPELPKDPGELTKTEAELYFGY